MAKILSSRPGDSPETASRTPAHGQRDDAAAQAAVRAVFTPFGADFAAPGGRPDSVAAAAVAAFSVRPENRAMAMMIVRGMRQVDQSLRGVAGVASGPGGSGIPEIDKRSRYLASAGGKRLRPLLVLLAAHLGEPTREQVITAAISCELIHLATLYHDDVMDEADVRRGVPSVNARFGRESAVLSGDLLFADAARMIARVGIDAVRLYAVTTSRLVAGQTRETVGAGALDDPIEHYLSVIADKTGSLTGACAALGALAAGCPAETVERLAEFGELIGLAFQISDDLLDLTGSLEITGKAPGTDLREGVPTLPVSYARRLATPDDARLLELLDGDLSHDDRLREAVGLLREHAGVRRAREDVDRYLRQARDCLHPLPDVPARQALLALCDVLGQRRR
jgi:heptaprenyl diphosphate synthase